MCRQIAVVLAVTLLSGCAGPPTLPSSAPPAAAQCVANACPVCPVCPAPEVPSAVQPAAKPLQKSDWRALPGWADDDLGQAFTAFVASCNALASQPLWRDTCANARSQQGRDATALRAWFEAEFDPWQLINPNGSSEGLVTGYYEPLLKGSRERKPPYLYPIYGVPADLIDVELGELYPELKHMRLRGRIEGRKLVPYFSRDEWERQGQERNAEALLWVDDAIDLFFMQIQGSGQVQLDDGSRTRVGYADQNGHPYRSIGRWLIDQGEIKAEQASMQGIKAWAGMHPLRLKELLDFNPSLVFFRELPVSNQGPPGALAVPLTAERSVAVDARYTPLGAPVWLATTYPNSERPLVRLVLAQDTGGAIRGPVRADFFWGSGAQAGGQAGKMRQKAQMWVLLPHAFVPK